MTLASIGDGVIVTDARGRATFLNGEAQRLTGWTNREAEGRPLPAVFLSSTKTPASRWRTRWKKSSVWERSSGWPTTRS